MRHWLWVIMTGLTAWALRRGVTSSQVDDALARSFPHRDAAWREDVIFTARRRNRAKLMRRVDA